MNIRSFLKRSLGVSLALVPIAGYCLTESPLPPVFRAADPEPGTTAAVAEQSSIDAQQGAADIADAPATPVPTEKSVLPNINLSGPAAEVARLANSGVDQSVLLAYVKNSSGTFNLSTEDIIYFKDVGFPDAVVSAMLQHDQILQASEAGVAAAPTMTSPAPEQAPTVYSQPTPAPTVADVASLPAETPSAAYPTFYDSLSPYGTWVYLEGYGYCWQPSVVNYNVGWRPYFDCGRWTYTDCGWYWASDYSWGWAPFHYGRWFNHHRLGWCWAPDNVWGPSWVSWRYSDDYCGWAPLPPSACFQTGIGLTWCGRPVAVGCDFGLRWDSFAFIDWHHFHEHRLRDYCVAPREINRVYNHTVVVNNITHNHSTIINAGIAPERVFAATHIPVHQLALREVSRPASPGRRFDSGSQTLAVYRPHIPDRGASTVAIASSPEAGRHQRPAIAGIHTTRDWTRASRPPEPAGSSGRLRNNQSLPIASNPWHVQAAISTRPVQEARGTERSSAPIVVERQTQTLNARERFRPTMPEVTQRHSELVQRRYPAPSEPSRSLPMRSGSSTATRLPYQTVQSERSYSSLSRTYSPPVHSQVQNSPPRRFTTAPFTEFQRQAPQPANPQPRYSPQPARSYTLPTHSVPQQVQSFSPRAYTPERSYSAPQRSYSPPQSFAYSGPSHFSAPRATPGASYAFGVSVPPASQSAPSSRGRSNDASNSRHRPTAQYR